MVEKIKYMYQDNPDLIINKLSDEITCIYFASLCSQDKINEYITKPILNGFYISAPNKKIIDLKNVNEKLHNGFAILINKKKIYACEVKANLQRSIDTPDSEPSINGPKDSLTENIETNLGLIKRRIKSDNLYILTKAIGKYTKTTIDILYISDKVNKTLLKSLVKKISNITEEEVLDSGNLSNILQKKSIFDFPTIMPSERPDEISSALCDGKIIILVDNSPFALILPAFFTDFINPISDKYSKPLQTNFLKLIRYICLIITLVEPAYYIATINYNQETIPTSLLVNFMIQRGSVPFPSIAEALIMLIIYEMLRESDARFPSKYGSTISILGALILGEAAVSAGIVSPIMIITIALCYITSLVFNNPDFNNELRIYRFIFLISSGLLGLYGIFLSFIFLLIKLCSSQSFNSSYTYPLAPFSKKYFHKYVWRRKK